MRTTLWLGVIFSTSALAACGGGSHDADAPPGTPDSPIVPTIDAAPDARPDADPLLPDADPTFSCLGQPLPTTAPTTLTIGGDVAELSPGGAAFKGGVTVNAYAAGNPTPVGSDVSANDGTGAYSITLDNPGGTPIDGYAKAVPGSICGTGSNQACMDVYLTPPTPIYEDIPNAIVRTVSQNNFALIYLLTGESAPADHAGTAVVGMIVTDCQNNPLAGATVSSTPAGTGPTMGVHYNSGGLPSGSATQTDTDGFAYIMNLPPGNVTVRAEYGGMTLRAHVIVAHAWDTDNALNTTTIRP
jgi:hypothetical protein